MERITHLALKRTVDKLMLLNPALALERGAYNVRCIMISISRQVADLNNRIRKRVLDESF